MTATIGSAFTGYGGLDRGAATAIPGARLAWTAELRADLGLV